MKTNVFLIGLCTSFLTTANAQLTKTNWLVGGNGKFSSIKGTNSSPSITYDSKYTDLTFSPNIGYFILDKFAVGIKSSFNWEKNITYPPGGGTTDQRRFMLGPFVRYYLLSYDKQLNFLIEPAFQFGTYRAGAAKGSNNTVTTMAGPVFYFNSSVGLELLAGYYLMKENVGNLSATRKGFQLSIGFQIHLMK
jgi:hypothetical protein